MTKDVNKRKPKKNKHKLSENQLNILNWICKDRLTIKQIQRKKNLKSPNAIYKTINKLRQYGYLTKSLTIEESLIKQFPKDKHLRLHAESFNIKILYKDNEYYKIIKKLKNRDIRDFNTIELNENSLTIYSNKDFFGSSVEECFKNSSDYWNKFIKLLENDYKITLIKPRGTKIYKFRQHIADIRNPLSKKVIKESKHFKVFDLDGELRLLIDNSFIPEFEAVNFKHCKTDMQKAQNFYEDLILNDNLNLSQLTKISQENTTQINKISKQLLETNQALNILVQQQTQTIQIQQHLIKALTPKQREVKESHIYGSYFM
jgi:hypothetical protein